MLLYALVLESTYMRTRQSIPASIVREVLVESGHRCAVCGAPVPLERAHIVPWHRTTEHTASNLITLCANCHERADREQWGEKTLREYKVHPWVLRQKMRSEEAPENPLTSTTRVELTIDLSFEDFDESREKLLRYALAGFLGISPESVSIAKISKG